MGCRGVLWEIYAERMILLSKSRSYSRRSVGVMLVVGVLAGLTVGGGVGVIAGASTTTVTVCANKTTKMLRYPSNGKCLLTERTVLLNQTGTNGTNGANTNSQIKNICGDDGTTACAVGLKGPGGGIVFMTPSTLGNTSGLFYEAAPSTWSSPYTDLSSVWCNNSNTLLGVASVHRGPGAMDGAAKTTVMLGVCTIGAAKLADAYTATVNGVVYGDWFLPSKGELNQMYINRIAIGGFSTRTYWSSSEGSANDVNYGTTAWSQSFGNGIQGHNGKNLGGMIYVRPVRAF